VLRRKKLDLKREYRKSTQQLAELNRDLAAKMILLASQTGDTAPLIQAVDALQKADQLLTRFTRLAKRRTMWTRSSALLNHIVVPLRWHL